MNLDKILEERFFHNNSKEEIEHWCQKLYYFHYMRARGVLEKYSDELGWKNSLNEDIKSRIHCISEDKYPELFQKTN